MQLIARLLLVVLSVSFSGSTWAIQKPPGSHNLIHWPPPPPPPVATGVGEDVTTGWIDQKLDHYDPTSTTTWRQRYFVNTNFYKNVGPAFLFMGGESAADETWVLSGQMVVLADKHGALAFELEHRYFGESRPTKDMSTENLRYLTIEQALEDTAYFIEHMNNKYQLNDTKWIVFGGSYPGMLAAWMRLKYPHLVHGSVASSAPVLAQKNFTGYFEVVGTDMMTFDPQCYADVKNATAELNELLRTEEGAQRIAKLFNFCQTPDISNKDDIFNIQYIRSLYFASTAQYDDFEQVGMGVLCSKMIDSEWGATPLERYSTIISQSECQNTSFVENQKYLMEESWTNGYTDYRGWLYLMCTGVGFFETSDSVNQPFTGFPVQYYVDLCTLVFGERYNEAVTDSAVESTNILYGGQRPEVSNVLFVNGDTDPWHVLGVLEDLSPTAPAIVIRGASHCRDLYGELVGDPAQMTEAHQKIAAIVKQWIDQ